MEVEVTHAKLFQVIGEQAVTIMVLKDQLTQARGDLQDATADVNRLRGVLAGRAAVVEPCHCPSPQCPAHTAEERSANGS